MTEVTRGLGPGSLKVRCSKEGGGDRGIVVIDCL